MFESRPRFFRPQEIFERRPGPSCTMRTADHAPPFPRRTGALYLPKYTPWTWDDHCAFAQVLRAGIGTLMALACGSPPFQKIPKRARRAAEKALPKLGVLRSKLDDEMYRRFPENPDSHKIYYGKRTGGRT